VLCALQDTRLERLERDLAHRRARKAPPSNPHAAAIALVVGELADIAPLSG